MKQFMQLCALLLSFSVMAAKTNREPDSPSGNYHFTLAMIQDAVRAAVEKADKEIERLENNGTITSIAERYFGDYLDKIASYNNVRPQTIDLVESYKTDLANAMVLKEFKDRYPKLIYDQSKWMFNSVGGVYANTIILYCSPKEYIVIWGTTLKSHGKFSGYYPYMNEFDVMVRGEMHSHDLDAPGHASVIYRPVIQDHKVSTTVDTSNLTPSNVRSYTLLSHTYMVSYAQGNIVKAFFPGAIMPGIFVNQDWGGLTSHIKEGIKAFFSSKRKTQTLDPQAWRSNPNYRALAIIDEV